MMNKNKAKSPLTYNKTLKKLVTQMKRDRPRILLAQLRKGHNPHQFLSPNLILTVSLKK